MRHRTRVLTFLLGALLPAGCATVTNTPKQRIEILSQPSGARVTVAGQTLQTPAFVELPRKDKEVLLNVEMEGYEPAAVTLKREATGKPWWNLTALAAGLVAAVVIEQDEWQPLSPDADGGTSGGTTALIAGGVVAAAGIASDFTTGAAYELKPGRVVVLLKPLSTPATPAALRP